jgi:hypothetical protein
MALVNRLSMGILALAMLGAFVPPAVALSSGPPATAAKKAPCDPKCKKRRHADRRRATRFLAGTTISRTATFGPGEVLNARIDFCRDGTLAEQATTSNSLGSRTASWKANWRVESVSRHKSLRLAGIRESNVRDFASSTSDGSPGSPPPPPVFSFTITWSSPSPVTIDGFEYTHTAGIC